MKAPTEKPAVYLRPPTKTPVFYLMWSFGYMLAYSKRKGGGIRLKNYVDMAGQLIAYIFSFVFAIGSPFSLLIAVMGFSLFLINKIKTYKKKTVIHYSSVTMLLGMVAALIQRLWTDIPQLQGALSHPVMIAIYIIYVYGGWHRCMQRDINMLGDL